MTNVNFCIIANHPNLHKTIINYINENEIIPSISEREGVIHNLGVILYVNLNFSEHISKILKASDAMTNWFLKIFGTTNLKLILKIYKIYIRPILEYCCGIYNPRWVKDINRLENFQKYFTRRILQNQHYSYAESLALFSLEPLEIRRIRISLIQLYKIVKNTTHNRHNTPIIDKIFNSFIKYNSTRSSSLPY